MTILVTGAGGFVGRALCRRLLADGHAVAGTAGRDRPLPDGVERRPIASIGPTTAWTDALAGIDTVVHLAARVHVLKDRAADPAAEFRAVNRDGTLHLAQAAARLGVRRFVFMSSIRALGHPIATELLDEATIPAPADPFGISKWEAEQDLAQLAAEGTLHTTILRPPLVYGPGVTANFRTLLQAVARGWPLPFGAIERPQSLIFVDNLADAVASILAEAGGACETFHVSDGEDVSIAELIRRLAADLGRPARLLPLPPALLLALGFCLGKRRAVERLLFPVRVDGSAFRRRFGWTPPYSLAQGLAATAAWFRGKD
jgi:nucleoside-diphosphate-sugar epimerase